MRRILCLCLALLVCVNLYAPSIAQLAQHTPLPRPYGYPIKVLNLSNMGIDSLDGLAAIPGIETAHVIALNGNNLDTIPAGSFTDLPRLRAVSLMNNRIVSVDKGAFDANIRVILFNGNKISSFMPGTFDDLKKLWLLSIGDNPLSPAEMKALSQQLPGVFFVRYLTRKNLQTAGIVAGALTLIAVAAVGSQYVLNNLAADNDLIDAAVDGKLKRAASALLRGADVNARDSYGKTPLIWAVGSGNTELIQKLLDEGANPYQKDKYGNNALTFAPEDIKELILTHQKVQQQPTE